MTENHYGSRSQRGSEVAAVFSSLIESAKLCEVEPKALNVNIPRTRQFELAMVHLL